MIQAHTQKIKRGKNYNNNNLQSYDLKISLINNKIFCKVAIPKWQSFSILFFISISLKISTFNRFASVTLNLKAINVTQCLKHMFNRMGRPAAGIYDTITHLMVNTRNVKWLLKDIYIHTIRGGSHSG